MTKWALFNARCSNSVLTLKKKINIIHHINRIKEKNSTEKFYDPVNGHIKKIKYLGIQLTKHGWT